MVRSGAWQLSSDEGVAVTQNQLVVRNQSHRSRDCLRYQHSVEWVTLTPADLISSRNWKAITELARKAVVMKELRIARASMTD